VQKFDSAAGGTYRTNICAQQQPLFEEQIELGDALRGLDLSVAITNYQGVPNEERFFALDDVTGGIRTSDPGLFVVILDELARRAGFRWRHSFAAIRPLSAAVDGNKTWTDLLEWEIDHFDIAAEYWGRSEARMALGISFPKGWYDGSIILAQTKDTSNQDNSSFWSFLLPFDGKVWLAIIAAILFTGLMYFVLERVNVESDERELENKPAAAIFLAALTFTGHFQFQPNTTAARLLSFR
jgi:hypothetical protein